MGRQGPEAPGSRDGQKGPPPRPGRKNPPGTPGHSPRKQASLCFLINNLLLLPFAPSALLGPLAPFFSLTWRFPCIHLELSESLASSPPPPPPSKITESQPPTTTFQRKRPQPPGLLECEHPCSHLRIRQQSLRVPGPRGLWGESSLGPGCRGYRAESTLLGLVSCLPPQPVTGPGQIFLSLNSISGELQGPEGL